MLECLHLGHTLWKHKIPQDTEDEGKVWAVQWGWGRGHALGATPGMLCSQASHTIGSTTSWGSNNIRADICTSCNGVAAAAAAAGPGLDEVVVKKAALVWWSIRWLLWSGRGATCPSSRGQGCSRGALCHACCWEGWHQVSSLSSLLQDGVPPQEAYGCALGWAVSCWSCDKLLASH